MLTFHSFYYIKNILSIITPIIGLILAYFGLSTWREQLWGKTEYEIARKLLRATYECREAVNYVRHPFISSGEMQPPADKSDINDEKKKSFYGIANAYEKRWNKVIEARTNLDTELLEAEVLWGQEIRTEFNDLFEVIKELFINLSHYLNNINPDSGTKLDYDWNILYSNLTEDDEYTKKMKKSISKVEEKLKPHFSR